MNKKDINTYPVSSFELTKWAIRQKPRLKVEKLILISLCDHVNNKTGRCDPSIETLRDDGMCSKSVCMRAIKALENDKFIETIKSTGKRTKYKINYTGVAHDTTGQKSSVTHDTTTSVAHDTAPVSPTTPEQSNTEYLNKEKNSPTEKPTVEHNHPHIQNDSSDYIFGIQGDEHKQSEIPVLANPIYELSNEYIKECDRVKFNGYFGRLSKNPTGYLTIEDCLVNKADELGAPLLLTKDLYGYIKSSVNSLKLDGVTIR